jgi:hypothetical protein
MKAVSAMSDPSSTKKPEDHDDIEQQTGVDLLATKAAELDLEVAKANLDLVINWVSHADSKATFYLTVAVAMLGASLTEIPSLVRVCQHFASTSCWWVPAILIATHLAFYGSSLVSAYKSIEVVKPRLAPDSKTHSWYFFQSVAAFADVEKWRDFTHGLKGAERLQHLVDQIWNVSRVAVAKYKAAGTADFALRVAFCFGTASVLVTLVLDEVARQ